MRGLFKNQSAHPVPSLSEDQKVVYAIGDIHGRHDLLLRLIGDIKKDIERRAKDYGWPQKVTMIFLGDYIDRGLQSKSVIDTLLNLEIFGAKFIFLKGNHEAVLLDFLKKPEVGLKWTNYGGRETLASYGIDLPVDLDSFDEWDSIRNAFLDVIPPHHLLFLWKLKIYQIYGDFMFVHAGLDPDLPAEMQTENEYLWVRDKFLKSKKKFPYIVVHGHTPQSQPIWNGRRIGIDTGAYISNTLTAVRIADESVDFLFT